MGITHEKVATAADDPTKEVNKGEWNADHVATVGLNAQTGTTYTLVDADNGKMVKLTNASAIALTVPSGLVDGFSCLLQQGGAGTVTVSAGGGVTLHSRGSAVAMNGQYAIASLVNEEGTETYVLGGDLA